MLSSLSYPFSIIALEGGKVFAGASAQVSTGTFDPEDFDFGTGERIELGDFGRGIAPAGVGDALVAGEQVGAVNQTTDWIKGSGFVVVQGVVDVFIYENSLRI